MNRFFFYLVLTSFIVVVIVNAHSSITKIQVTDDPATSESAPRICVDSNGNLHIAYISTEGSTRKVKYTNNVGGTFVNPIEIDTAGWPYGATAIAVDSNDKIHIAYTGDDDENGHRFIYYINNISGAFGAPTEVSPKANYLQPKLAVDSNAKAHIRQIY